MSEHELIETDDDDDGEVLLPTVPLSPKELAFCEAFGNPESETFGNARKSAEVAGYGEPHNAGWKLRRRPRIIAKLKSYHVAVTVAVGRVLADLENERRLAIEKGDLSTAVRATELMGKHLGMFRDVLAIDEPATAARYDARVAADVQRITAFLLLGPQSPAAMSELPPGSTPAEMQKMRDALTQEPQAPQERQESEK
jgi:hypothetical protein